MTKSKVGNVTLPKQHVDSVTDGFILRFLEGLNSPRALTVYLLYKYGEHMQLINLEPNFDCDFFIRKPYQARDDYIATEFLSKANFLKTGINQREVALEKFRNAETQCHETYKRLNALDLDPRNVGEKAIQLANRKISKILGTFSPSQFLKYVNWGPGASSLLSSKMSHRYDKYQLETGMSAHCRSFWTDELWLSAFPGWETDVKVCSGKLTTVPKNSKTDRCIVIEPGLTTFLQLGLGGYLKARLKVFGLDLSRGQDVHRSIVLQASKDCELATVDLSAASDTISTALVQRLLPEDWFNVLYSHTTRDVRVGGGDGERLSCWKFSSMGNGFTFELESLIFFALAHAVTQLQCVDGRISVYGDDIILPTKVVSTFQEVVEYCGFRFNEKKTGKTGYFRESCGMHSFFGLNSSPIYLREKLTDVFAIFKMANQTRRLAHNLNTYGCDARLRSAWYSLSGRSTTSLFDFDLRDFYIPDGFGDGGFAVEFDMAVPRRDVHYQRGYLTRVLVPVFKKHKELDNDRFLFSKLIDMCLEDKDLFPNEKLNYVAKLKIKENTVTLGNKYPDFSSAIKFKSSLMWVDSWKSLGPWL